MGSNPTAVKLLFGFHPTAHSKPWRVEGPASARFLRNGPRHFETGNTLLAFRNCAYSISHPAIRGILGARPRGDAATEDAEQENLGNDREVWALNYTYSLTVYMNISAI